MKNVFIEGIQGMGKSTLLSQNFVFAERATIHRLNWRGVHG